MNEYYYTMDYNMRYDNARSLIREYNALNKESALRVLRNGYNDDEGIDILFDWFLYDIPIHKVQPHTRRLLQELDIERFFEVLEEKEMNRRLEARRLERTQTSTDTSATLDLEDYNELKIEAPEIIAEREQIQCATAIVQHLHDLSHISVYIREEAKIINKQIAEHSTFKCFISTFFNDFESIIPRTSSNIVSMRDIVNSTLFFTDYYAYLFFIELDVGEVTPFIFKVTIPNHIYLLIVYIERLDDTHYSIYKVVDVNTNKCRKHLSLACVYKLIQTFIQMSKNTIDIHIGDDVFLCVFDHVECPTKLQMIESDSYLSKVANIRGYCSVWTYDFMYEFIVYGLTGLIEHYNYLCKLTPYDRVTYILKFTEELLNEINE